MKFAKKAAVKKKKKKIHSGDLSFEELMVRQMTYEIARESWDKSRGEGWSLYCEPSQLHGEEDLRGSKTSS
jgi:hypothetical protein